LNNHHFQIPAYAAQQGSQIDLDLEYAVYGQLNEGKDNCILVTTSYSGTHEDAQDLFAKSNTLDLSDYCVVVVNMLSNSMSSSPSNTSPPFDGPRFPVFTVHDNVICQHKLITEELGVSRLRLVMGYSMGGLQTFEWGAQHSDMVDAILPVCGAAKVSPHNWLFLEGAKAALTADGEFASGDYAMTPEVGMEAFAKVYAGWLFSQEFFREELHKNMGLETLNDVIGFLKAYFSRREANDLLGMLATWQAADISRNEIFNGELDIALAAITAKAIVMPGRTDLYFRVADSEYEVAKMPNAELRVIESKLGHLAGSGMDPEGKATIDRAIIDLLS
jgi:homoserine O-acetyltransferase